MSVYMKGRLMSPLTCSGITAIFASISACHALSHVFVSLLSFHQGNWPVAEAALLQCGLILTDDICEDPVSTGSSGHGF